MGSSYSVTRPTKYCHACGNVIDAMAVVCPKCGVMQSGVPALMGSEKKILPAFLLCFTLGVFGAHRFYAGKIGTGLLQLFTLGGLASDAYRHGSRSSWSVHRQRRREDRRLDVTSVVPDELTLDGPHTSADTDREEAVSDHEPRRRDETVRASSRWSRTSLDARRMVVVCGCDRNRGGGCRARAPGPVVPSVCRSSAWARCIRGLRAHGNGAHHAPRRRLRRSARAHERPLTAAVIVTSGLLTILVIVARMVEPEELSLRTWPPRSGCQSCADRQACGNGSSEPRVRRMSGMSNMLRIVLGRDASSHHEPAKEECRSTPSSEKLLLSFGALREGHRPSGWIPGIHSCRSMRSTLGSGCLGSGCLRSVASGLPRSPIRNGIPRQIGVRLRCVGELHLRAVVQHLLPCPARSAAMPNNIVSVSIAE